MAPLRTEETLHHYLRRHFFRISQSNALQLAEETGAREQNALSDAPSPASAQLEHDEPAATFHL